MGVVGKKRRSAADQERELWNNTVGMRQMVPLSQIKDRVNGDTRQTSREDVVLQAKAIAALGLINPIRVDNKMRLLAGGHRLAALRLLSIDSLTERQKFIAKLPTDENHMVATQNKGWTAEEEVDRLPLPDTINTIKPGFISVTVAPFDSKKDPHMAINVEVAENGMRRNYTAEEVVKIRARLEECGYYFGYGRPPKGKTAGIYLLMEYTGLKRSAIKNKMRSTKLDRLNQTHVRKHRVTHSRQLAYSAAKKLATRLEEISRRTQKGQDIAFSVDLKRTIEEMERWWSDDLCIDASDGVDAKKAGGS